MEPSFANFQIGMSISAWLNYVCAAYTRNPQTGEYYAPVVTLPADYRVGKTYHKWLKIGALIHQYGFDAANHFVKLPVGWLSETHHTETIPGYTDENGEQIPEQIINVTNEEYFKQRLHKNDTHCLVWLTDDNYNELSKQIIFDSDNNATNIIAEDKYFAAISEGGEFYVEPVEKQF